MVGKFFHNTQRYLCIVTIVSLGIMFPSPSGASSESLSADTKLVLEEMTRSLNLEKLLPCYKLTVTEACLGAIRRLQKFGHIPSSPAIFRAYAAYGQFQGMMCWVEKSMRLKHTNNITVRNKQKIMYFHWKKKKNKNNYSTKKIRNESLLFYSDIISPNTQHIIKKNYCLYECSFILYSICIYNECRQNKYFCV